MSRPTKYSNDILNMAENYLENYEKHGDNVPSIVGVASVLGISRQTAMEWKNDPEKAEFSYTLERIKDRQHRLLLNKGLTGEFNASITKLMLHNFGYSDKQQIDKCSEVQVVEIPTCFDDLKELSIEQLERIATTGKL